MLIKKLFEGELPVPSEESDVKWRRWWLIGIALFSINFACFVVLDALFNHNIMLGPGLVDTGLSPFEWAQKTLEPFIEDQQFGFVAFVLFGGLICMIVNALVTYRSFADYEKRIGTPFPLQIMNTFTLLNGIMVGIMILILLLCGLIAAFSGFNFTEGMAVVRWMTQYSHEVVERVPTLIELPYPLPLFAAILATDFFYYWFHRWGHTLRLWWLLWHRPHHMTPVLSHPTTQPVFAAAPLFIIFSIPFQIIVGSLAKIFGPETMIMEALMLRMLVQLYSPYAHNTAYYEWFGRSKWRLFIGHVLGVGNHHYTHHSALPGHEAINLSGMGFFIWDHVFGTYVKPPKEKPPVGLTGSPELYMNPLRLALSGIAQLVYEWRRNKGFFTKLKIIFGGTDWSPPVTKDFAIKKA